uniref:Uncharacterized protein n=1 Tax=Tanacetum cinerariifolium TaxID=118510 RepID=A0A6L2KXP5_TANCI|nr:hypothetical protein [Tanacetum cinerariifolium]
MNTNQAQHKALDDALVAPMDCLEFEKGNMRLKTDIKPKEATFQVSLDALALTSFYQAFLITVEVPLIYMQEFWATVSVHKSSIRFTINKKKISLDVDTFREILQICTWETYTNVSIDYLHQPWRAFVTIINKYLSGKDTAYEKIFLSCAQILCQDEEDVDEETDLNDDNEETKSNNDGDDLTHPNLSTYKADDEEEKEKIDNKEMSSDQRVSTPPEYELSNEEENKEGDDKDKEGEQVQDKEDDLYKDVNINLESNDDEMTDAQANQDTKDSHVTLTPVPPVAQQHSFSVSSDMVSKFINPSSITSKSAHAKEHDQMDDDSEDQPHQESNKKNNDDECQWNPSSSPTPDHEWHKTKTVDNRPPQPWITQIAQAGGTQSLFNEFLATPINFSAFIMHQLKIDNMTQEILTGLTNDQLDWHNLEGKPYPHDLSKPLPLILNEQGHQVIPLDHFINNDLEYLKSGSSSKKIHHFHHQDKGC